MRSPTKAPARKVKAATAGAGAGGVTAGLVLWALGEYVFKDGVPDPVSAFVLVVVPAAVALVSGYLTEHAPRDLGRPTMRDKVDEIKGRKDIRRDVMRRKIEHPHGLGRHVEHDERSKHFPVPRTTAVKSKTWHHYGAVLDQGGLGSCTGNAIAQALNTAPLHTKGVMLREADALKLYEAATRLDNVPGEYPPDDTGSSGLAAAKAAQRAGLISSYRHAFGLAMLLNGLQTGPAIVGTDWLEGMFEPDADGRVHPAGDVAGGHEYLCLGVDQVRKRLWFLNSWGPGWGINGRFYMTFADFETLLLDGGDAVFPVR